MTERCVAWFTCPCPCDYVLVDDVNYDQTTKLNHTVLTDQMTPVRIIGSALSRTIASNFLCI